MPSKTIRRRKHTANARVQIHGLSKRGASIEVDVFSDGTKVGTLALGRGSFTWFGNKRRRGIVMSWSRFAAFMEE